MKPRTDTELLDALEALARGGACPAIINDDNGHWTVCDEGIQTVPFGPEAQDINTSFFIEASQWHDSIRDAINAYLDKRTSGD